MRRIDHDALGFRSFPGKPDENAVEHAEPALANEAVVERLVRPVAGWRVLPLQAVADHVDDAAHHPPVIDTRNPVRQREKRRYPRHLALAQQKEPPITASFSEAVNHISNGIDMF